MIKTWQQRCEGHPDHEGIVTEQMIRDRMQEEIDELRQALSQPVDNVYISEKRVHKTGKSIHEPVAWMVDNDGNKYEIPEANKGPLLKAMEHEWVGLTGNEARKFYEKYTDREELIYAIDKFLEEKNGG